MNKARKTGLVMVEEWKITVDKFVTDAIAKLGEASQPHHCHAMMDCFQKGSEDILCAQP